MATDTTDKRSSRAVRQGAEKEGKKPMPTSTNGVERAASVNDRRKALDTAVTQIERAYGKGSIMRMVDVSNKMAVEAIPTGSIALDLALGVGGIPRGRITEIYGPESSGKTTLCYHVIAEAQKMGGIAAFVDTEHALDPSYARKCGVDLDNLYISQPDTGEQALEITETLVRSGAIDVIVVDSVAALVPAPRLTATWGTRTSASRRA